MLYERWIAVARERRDQLAVRDIVSGEDWTFGRLFDAAASRVVSGPIAMPQGSDVVFVLDVIAAWKAGLVLCPLEVGQSRPSVLDDSQKFPPGTVHLKMTSATSGPAKCVAFTAEQLAADCDQIIGTMGLRPECPNIAVLSLAHSYGFSNLILPLLLSGIPLVLGGSPLPQNVLRAASGFDAVTLPAVPALWRVWLEADAIPRNVKLAISAGAPLPLPLEAAVHEQCGVKIHNFIGASECGGIAYDASSKPRTDAAWAGTAMKGVGFSIDDDGCLVVKSAAAATAYWPAGDAKLGDGCFVTSDLAELRDDGLWLRGRAGDVINVAGRKVSPEEIERVLQTHPDVVECLVVGLPAAEGDSRGEQVGAVVVTRNAATREVLRQHLVDRLPGWQVPKEWLFVESLSPNQRGKLSRAEWRRRWNG
ncbi:MAG TPA: fatty acid--CoA ligase family protein [Roseimicrobium sp.]|nr:fatty acid--CoA ligase family protein [Roseimicrobium sp.]